MFKETDLIDAMRRGVHAPRPEPDPNPEPNPEPDSTVNARRSEISPADWDILFHAVIERLETCAGHAPLAEMPEHALGVSGSIQTTLRECVVSMKWLQVALLRERDQHQPRC